jgi:hypothetical protein
VIGHYEKVERLRELHPLAGVCSYLLAAGELIGVFRPENRAEGARVERDRRVNVRVAE